MELAPMILGPPIVLPVLVAVEHALEPFEGAVPADLGPLDQAKRLDAPLFARWRVPGRAQAFDGASARKAMRLVEALYIDLLVQEVLRHEPVELLFPPVLLRRVLVMETGELLAPVQHQRQLVAGMHATSRSPGS